MGRALLIDADGTVLDDHDHLREVWERWAIASGLEPGAVYDVALRLAPRDVFAAVAPHLDGEDCLRRLFALEDAHVRETRCAAFAGAAALLGALDRADWAVVTGNVEARTRLRFEQAGLPSPPLVVDATMVPRSKPAPFSYLRATAALGRAPEECLALEDSASGVRAAQAAGLTVWTVNAGPDGLADRTYATLAEAVPDVLAWYGAVTA